MENDSKNSRQLILTTIWLSVFLLTNNAVSADQYYVDATNGNDANPGASQATSWKTLAKVNAQSFRPGDSIHFKRGEIWAADLNVNSSGTASSPIIFDAYGSGGDPVIFGVTVYGDHTILENLVVDRNKTFQRAVRVRRAKNCVLRNLTVRNGTHGGVQAVDADGLLIESCLIHHFLAGSFTNQADAHGISAEDTQGLTIRNTEIHHVSGDSFQTDPDRDTDTPNDILIEDCHFWTSPLMEDFNSGWRAGQTPGENAIDTKMVKSGWEDLPRMRVTIRNMIAHGWIGDGFIANRAAFNMKEKIEAVFDGVTVYDCEIAFRLRGTRGNANVTIMNTVIYDCEKAIRAEDDLANLKVHNSTFGNNVDRFIQFAGGNGGKGSWDFRNNVFMDSKPSVAGVNSNKVGTSADFVDSNGRDYHLKASSGLVDVGENLPAVTIDRDGIPRSVPYDIGAYGHVRKQSNADVNSDGVVDLFDLTLVASQFGKRGAGLMGDVNLDGVVNVFDLVHVGLNLGKGIVAEPLIDSLKLLTYSLE